MPRDSAPDRPPPTNACDQVQTSSLHEACGKLGALVGCWRGYGEVDYPTIDGPYRFLQELAVTHDGRPFLQHTTQSWIVTRAGEILRPAAREAGWWRPGDERVELLLTHSTGIIELLYGTNTGRGAWTLRTEVVHGSATAKDVTAGKRHYHVTEPGTLHFTEERSMVGQPLLPHVAATLRRTAP